MSLETSLKKLRKSELIELLTAVYGKHDEIDALIDEALGSEEGGSAAIDRRADRLQKAIAQIAEDDAFIDYHSCRPFVAHLDNLLLEINTLGNDDLNVALSLTEDFMRLVDPVFSRADDSEGDISDVFFEAVDQWLDIATQIRMQSLQSRNWVESVLAFFNNNAYGCYDPIIAHSQNLLTEKELRQLAWRFENGAKRALTENNEDAFGYNSEAAHACIGLQSVAYALDDMSLYEKATLIRSPKPNTIQLESLVHFAMQINALDRAEYWLEQPLWQQDKVRQKELRNELLGLQGDIDQLKASMLQDFQQQPDPVSLGLYWMLANESERETIKSQVAVLSEPEVEIEDKVEMLIIVGSYAKAADCVMQQASHLSDMYCPMVLEWAEAFTEHQYILAAILCYRALLTDILNRSYSKAYHHAARYYHMLLALDKLVENYQTFDDAQSFVRTLKQPHGRKRKFWAEVEALESDLRD